jgi:hypothetical protein
MVAPSTTIPTSRETGTEGNGDILLFGRGRKKCQERKGTGEQWFLTPFFARSPSRLNREWTPMHANNRRSSACIRVHSRILFEGQTGAGCFALAIKDTRPLKTHFLTVPLVLGGAFLLHFGCQTSVDQDRHLAHLPSLIRPPVCTPAIKIQWIRPAFRAFLIRGVTPRRQRQGGLSPSFGCSCSSRSI